MKYKANPVIVDAVEIVDVGPITAEGSRHLALRDGVNMVAVQGMLSRMTPVPGDYVVTQEDGYVYLNPKAVFERKYREWGSAPDASDLIKWPGDPVESMPPARALLAADQQIFTAQEENQALFFHDGDQWDQEIKSRREMHRRPTLTINRIPLLVAASIAADPESYLSCGPGRMLSQVQQATITRLKIIITRRNMDAQKVYNFLCSAAAELAATKLPNDVDTVIESDGTVTGKPLPDLRGIR